MVKTGGVVRGDTADIQIYNKASGPPVDVTKFPEGIQLMFKQVQHTEEIEAYKKAKGHYPADYAEFKSGVVDPNNIMFPSKLPVDTMELQYDEANHKVVVAKKKK